MRWLLSIFLVVSPAVTLADIITVSVPHAVSQQIEIYREQCAEDGGALASNYFIAGLGSG